MRSPPHRSGPSWPAFPGSGQSRTCRIDHCDRQSRAPKTAVIRRSYPPDASIITRWGRSCCRTRLRPTLHPDVPRRTRPWKHRSPNTLSRNVIPPEGPAGLHLPRQLGSRIRFGGGPSWITVSFTKRGTLNIQEGWLGRGLVGQLLESLSKGSSPPVQVE